MTSPDQFYTGLIAQLYEPLAGGISPSDRFIEFAQQWPGPALELCCGTGLPLLDLVEAGLDVEGLDASADMLHLCREKAQARGLAVTLHHGLMQNFRIDRVFDAIYIANGSITLLPTDEALDETLRSCATHLAPGGGLLLDLDSADADVMREFIGHARETDLEDGSVGRFVMTAVETEDGGRNVLLRLRYEHHLLGGQVEVEERDWLRRIWTVDQMSDHLGAAGLNVVETVAAEHGITQITATKL